MTAHMNRMYKRAVDWSKFKPGVGNTASGAIAALIGGYIGNRYAGTKGMIAGGLGGGALGYGGYSAVDALLNKADKAPASDTSRPIAPGKADTPSTPSKSDTSSKPSNAAKSSASETRKPSASETRASSKANTSSKPSVSEAAKPNYAAMPYIRNPEANYKLSQFLIKHPEFAENAERLRREYNRRLDVTSKEYKERKGNGHMDIDRVLDYAEDIAEFNDLLGQFYMAEGGDEYVRHLADALLPSKDNADAVVAHAKRVADSIKLIKPKLDYEHEVGRMGLPVPPSLYNGVVRANWDAYPNDDETSSDIVNFLNREHVLHNDDARFVPLQQKLIKAIRKALR